MPGKEVVFDDNGNDLPPGTSQFEEADDSPAEVPDATEPDAEAPAPAAKYRIGDREFATQEEALAFANSQVSTLETERQLSDAYRQGIQDAVQHVNTQQSVTPPAPAEPEFDEQLYYENPAAFLKKYGQQIAQQVTSQVHGQLSEKELSNKIWNDFAARHPELADYRDEVEQTAAKHLAELKLVNSTKGQTAGFDYVALKVKSNFERYANAVKPHKQLPNSRQSAGTPGQSSSVTPKTTAKKPLSMAEQIRSIKPKRR